VALHVASVCRACGCSHHQTEVVSIMIPTSIDGTDITGATIDGTDVTEITVDGDTVFTAQTLPVAYSNLVAWYPFDSAEYGGSNADDVTAIIGGSGDDTAYDGTVSGATYQSSGGVQDINAGVNSGAFDFANSSDKINVTGASVSSTEWTAMAWHNNDGSSSNKLVAHFDQGNFNDAIEMRTINNQFTCDFHVNGPKTTLSSSVGTGWYHLCAQYDNGTVRTFKNGSPDQTGSRPSKSLPFDKWGIGNRAPSTITQDDSAGAEVDDVRLYDRVLSASEINQIYLNTEP